MSETQEPSQNQELQEMGILDHLEELRWCIARAVICILILFPVSVIYSSDIVDYVVRLSNTDSLITTSPTEIFMQRFRIGFMLSLYFAIPYILYQTWRFIAPGLYAKERKWGKYAVGASYVLFLLGSLFGLLVIVPICLNFFSSLETTSVLYTPRLAEMVSFILRISAATSLASQLPVVVVLLFALGMVSIETLSRVRPYVIVTVFVLAAVLTPPDITSQLLLGLPTCLIYEMSIIICRILNIGKDDANTKRSTFIKFMAFLTLFVIVFGGSFGLWYTHNWYKKNKESPLPSASAKNLSDYQAIFQEEGGPQKLSAALLDARTEEEKRIIYKVLLDNWDDKSLKDADRNNMLQFVFKPELILTRNAGKTTVDFKVFRQFNLPVNVDFYWQLKVNDRVFMWPDADNNYRYTYNKDKKAATIIRQNVIESIPLAEEYLKINGEYKLQAVLKAVSAATPQGSQAKWVDEVKSATQRLVIGALPLKK